MVGGGYARRCWPQTKAGYEPSPRAALRRYCMVRTYVAAATREPSRRALRRRYLQTPMHDFLQSKTRFCFTAGRTKHLCIRFWTKTFTTVESSQIPLFLRSRGRPLLHCPYIPVWFFAMQNKIFPKNLNATLYVYLPQIKYVFCTQPHSPYTVQFSLIPTFL